MQRITKGFLAVISAAAMTISITTSTVFADTGSAAKKDTTAASSDTGSVKKTGYKNAWLKGEHGWKYIRSNGEAAAGKPYKIDGVIYDFSYNGYAVGKYTGWVKEKGVSRRYGDGVPYTGWTKNKDGFYSYCFDGYKVTGEHQIGNKIYSFDKKGVYSGKSRSSEFLAEAAEIISTDAEKITVTISAVSDNGKKYASGAPCRMERWENGRWVDCKKNDTIYGMNDVELPFSYGKSVSASFDHKDYMSPPPENYLAEGYYRLTLYCWEEGKPDDTMQEVHAVFEVVPLVSMETSGDIYTVDNRDIEIKTLLKINSEKLRGNYSQYIDDIKTEIMSMTPEGWKAVDPDSKMKSEGYYNYDGECELLTNIYFTNYIPPSDAAVGYYKTVLTVDGKKYEKTFRIDSLDAEPWLDEYSLKSDDLTIRFTLSNNTEKTIEVHPKEISVMFEKKDGKWSVVDSLADVEFISVAQYLEPGEKTEAAFALDSYYSRDDLKPGTYAVNISGYGMAEFKLTDKAPDYSSMPYAKLSMGDIDKATISLQSAGDERIRQAEFTGWDAVGIVSILKQIVIGENAEEEYNSRAGTFLFKVKVKYRDGSEKTVVFRDDDMLEYKGTIVRCRKDPYMVLSEMFSSKLAALDDEEVRAGKKSGWFEIDGVMRFYSKGHPYTGGIKEIDGPSRYCLDGYPITGEYPIGGEICIFGDDGIYIEERGEYPVSGSCGGELFTDTRKISVKLTLNDKSGSYEVGMPTKLERWEKGRWTDCIDDPGTERTGAVVLDRDNKKGHITFDYWTGSEYSFVKDAYYRLTLPVRKTDDSMGAGQKIYVTFKAISEYGDF